MAGCVEDIRRALVLDLVLIAGTAIEQALSVGPHLHKSMIQVILGSPTKETITIDNDNCETLYYSVLF